MLWRGGCTLSKDWNSESVTWGMLKLTVCALQSLWLSTKVVFVFWKAYSASFLPPPHSFSPITEVWKLTWKIPSMQNVSRVITVKESLRVLSCQCVCHVRQRSVPCRVKYQTCYHLFRVGQGGSLHFKCLWCCVLFAKQQGPSFS